MTRHLPALSSHRRFQQTRMNTTKPKSTTIPAHTVQEWNDGNPTKHRKPSNSIHQEPHIFTTATLESPHASWETTKTAQGPVTEHETKNVVKSKKRWGTHQRDSHLDVVTILHRSADVPVCFVVICTGLQRFLHRNAAFEKRVSETYERKGVFHWNASDLVSFSKRRNSLKVYLEPSPAQTQLRILDARRSETDSLAQEQPESNTQRG